MDNYFIREEYAKRLKEQFYQVVSFLFEPEVRTLNWQSHQFSVKNKTNNSPKFEHIMALN